MVTVTNNISCIQSSSLTSSPARIKLSFKPQAHLAIWAIVQYPLTSPPPKKKNVLHWKKRPPKPCIVDKASKQKRCPNVSQAELGTARDGPGESMGSIPTKSRGCQKWAPFIPLTCLIRIMQYGRTMSQENKIHFSPCWMRGACYIMPALNIFKFKASKVWLQCTVIPFQFVDSR